MHSFSKISAILLLAATMAGVAPVAVAEVLEHAANGVTHVDYRLPGSLIIRQGSPERLTIEAESDVLKKLAVSIRGGTLTISSAGSFSTNKPLRATLLVKSLHRLEAGGSGDVIVDQLKGDALTVSADGSGDIELRKIEQDALTIVVEGSSNIDASGSGTRLMARIDGSGDIDASGYAARLAQASINGSGNIDLSVSEKLKADIAGAGDIRYRGNPTTENSISGAGSIRRH